MSCSQCAVSALLVTLVVGVQGHQIIYVDTENGTLNSSCWEGGLDQPCGSLEVADTGAKRYNSTIAVLLRCGTSNNTSTTAATFPRALSSLPLPTTDSRCNDQLILVLTDAMNYLIRSPAMHLALLGLNYPMACTCKCGKTIHGIVKCNETTARV